MLFVMTKKKGIFDIDLSNQFIPSTNSIKKKEEKREGITIEQALNTILRQMEVEGCRDRTLYDYRTITTNFMHNTYAVYLDDITETVIRDWLGTMKVKNSTRLTRLKCFKAFLSRCYDNGWIKFKYWKNIKIRVDTAIKEGATDDEVNLLLSVLDYSKFLDLRNACAILLMYRAGLRIGTISLMRERHVDFENMQLKLDGDVMKNHKGLILPIDKQLAYLLSILINQNDLIRHEYNQDNDLLFITMKGTSTINSITSNSIKQQLYKYTKQYGIKNINPHALRRGFASNLYKKSNDILLVSKALGHADLSVTTKYLHADLQNVADDIRRYFEFN